MGVLNFTDEDFRAMRAVQSVLIAALLPFRAKTEAALVVFALVRCARVMLRLYPEKTQRELLTAIVPYLQGQASGPRESILWTPERDN